MSENKQYRKKAPRRRKESIVQVRGDKEVVKTGQTREDTVVYRGIGIPNQFFTKLKYNQTFTVSTFPYLETLIRSNSVFDPVFALGGGQPMYLDEFSLLYSRYTVYASSITLTFINRTNTTEAAFIKVGVYPLTDSSTSSTVAEATERDNCIYAQLGPNTGDQGIVTMNAYAKIYKIAGKDKSQSGDDTMSALVTADPAISPLWHIFVGTLDGITNVNVHIDMTITYYVKFYDRLNVSRS